MFQYFEKHANEMRFREYCGQSFTECQYTLMGYGIPNNGLIEDENGQRINNEYIQNYIQRQILQEQRDQHRHREEQEDPNGISSKIVRATDNDVVLGRGTPYQTHPGNIRLTDLTKQWFDEYHFSNSKVDKTIITWDIVRTIQNKFGGRFLQKDPDDVNYWRIVDDETARQKVAYGFRSIIKMNKHKQKHEK